jgi:hypothetical protein
MKHIKKFNEELSVDNPENFDSEEVSMSLSDWWISCDDALPKHNQLVVTYAPESQMSKVNICEFKKGISKEERKQMSGGYAYVDTERARRIKVGDEDGNNRKPYCFKVSGGPGQYFGQEVTHWMPLPSDPGTI